VTKDKIRQVIGIYRRYFESRGIPAIAMLHDEPPRTREEALQHCHSMLDKMEEFVNKGRIDKAFRWLGFVQACLWVHTVHTLDELMDHNRPREGD